MTKNLESSVTIIGRYDTTIRSLCDRATQRGLQQPLVVEMFDSKEVRHFHTPIETKNGAPSWNREYPKMQGRVDVVVGGERFTDSVEAE